jgi:hypothetical protein
MVLDDRAADRQPHPQAARLGRVERLEDTLGIGLRQTWTRIAYRDQHPVRLGFAGADQQFARSLADFAHRFNGIHDQVQDHLLQLDSVSGNARQTLRQSHLHRNAMVRDRGTGQCHDLENRFVDFQLSILCRRLLGEITKPAHNIGGPLAVFDNMVDRLSDLLQIWWLQRALGLLQAPRGSPRGSGVPANEGRRLSPGETVRPLNQLRVGCGYRALNACGYGIAVTVHLIARRRRGSVRGLISDSKMGRYRFRQSRWFRPKRFRAVRSGLSKFFASKLLYILYLNRNVISYCTADGSSQR